MTVGAALLVYAIVLGTLGRRAVRPGGWLGPVLSRAPRLGATLVLTAAWSVLTALFLAGLTIALPGTALSSGVSDVLDACIIRLRSAYATPGGAAVAGAGLTLSATIAFRVGWSLIRGARIRRDERRRHRTLIALCGRGRLTPETVVLEQSQPAVYCLSGRPRTVVLTSATLDVLSEPQLAAVLAHEQAHLRARHHRLLAAAALGRSALPEMPLLRHLQTDVGRLVEMHADDLALRMHDPETLATALIAVARARPNIRSAGRAVVLAAADTDAAERIRRLLLPQPALNHRRRRTVRVAAAALGAIPVLLAVTPAAVAMNQPPVRAASALAVIHPLGGVTVGSGAAHGR